MKTLKEFLNEGIDYELYHDSYTAAIAAAVQYVEGLGFETSDEEMSTEIGMGPGKPKKGKTVKHSLTLYKNNKEQRKMLHIQVFNRDTNRNTYELNCYVG